MKKVSSQILLFAFLVFIALLPLYRQISYSPAGTFYSKWHGDLLDYYTYISYIHQGRSQFQINWTFTTDDRKATLLHGFYLMLGRIGKFTSFSDIDLYHLSIFVALLFFYIYSLKLIKTLIPKSYWSFTVFLIFFASPFPNLKIPIINTYIGTGDWTKMDIYWRLTHVPHHFYGVSLMVVAAYYFIRFLRTNNLKLGVLSSLLLGLSMVIFIVPGLIFVSALIIVTSLCLGVWVWKLVWLKGISMVIKIHQTHIPNPNEHLNPNRYLNLKRLLIGLTLIFLVSLISFIYVKSQLAGTGIEKLELSYFNPEKYPYLFSIFVSSYGILPFFFPFGIYKVIKSRNFEWLLISALSLVPFLLYLSSVIGILPINKIRFMYSVPYLFSGLLAVYGIDMIISSSRKEAVRRLVSRLIIGVIFLNSISGLFFYWRAKLIPATPYQNVYIKEKYMKAVDFLDLNTPKFSKLLVEHKKSIFIPAFSDTKVFAGHPQAFYDDPKKKEILDRFAAGKMSESELGEVLSSYKIDYVLWEGELPDSYLPLLDEVFRSEDVYIYKIK